MMSKEYKIEISPEILELLGPSLYTNIYYVLAELIANAYDADAHNVYVIENASSIIVEDDGEGMDYEVGIKKYLNVAKPTRVDSSHDTTPNGRKRMGRKGIGKLAALSVSENVRIMTIRGKDKSGFVLSRSVPEDHLLMPIPEDDIHFQETHENGTAVVMDNPEYGLHRTLQAQKRNIMRMFPIVSDDFKIHIVSDKGRTVIDKFEEEIIPQLSTLITIGDEFKHLADYFETPYKDIEDRLLIHIDSDELAESIRIKDKDGKPVDCVIEIKGWIGTYITTTNRKKNPDDFPDNFLSLFANGKLGSFNIIPEIGANRMSESYVVGQLHIDCFERTDLPDMAMSNRQGYKSDDPRYQTAIGIIRNHLFNRILNMRDVYTDRKKADREKKKREDEKRQENELGEKAKIFADSVSSGIIDAMPECVDPAALQEKTRESVNDNLKLIGIKRRVDANKKKLLISHAGCDKHLADLIYDLLIINNVDPEDIIYTSSENEKSRVPFGYPIFDYLRDFFVESVSSQMINVLFVTSKESSQRWMPVCEVGAAWITRADHQIFNIMGHQPQAPLDGSCEWHECMVLDGKVVMTPHDADVFKVKIREICGSLGVRPLRDEKIEEIIHDRVDIVECYPTNGCE